MNNKSIILSVMTAVLMSACDGGEDVKSKPELRGHSMASEAIVVQTPSKNAGDVAQTENVAPLGYLLDVNAATEAQLAGVPNLTPKVKELITDLRPFLDITEFDDELDLLGISTKKREAFYEHIFMPIDVNNSPKEEFLYIPGMSKKMAFAIENARPYSSEAVLQAKLDALFEGETAEKILQYFMVAKQKNE